MAKKHVKVLLDRVLDRPLKRQEELAEIAERDVRPYHASPEELVAVDEAERSGIASEQVIEAAFRAFRRT